MTTKVVYRNRWMTVREDAIVRADGTPGLYGVVEKNAFAVVAAVDDRGLHLVEQYRYPVAGRYWEMPQGAWEGREIEPLELARAELREETGLVAGSMVHVAHLFQAYGFSNLAADLWFATDLEQHAVEREPEEQGMIVAPFPIAEVEAMIGDGTIKDAMTVAAFGLLRMKGLV